MEEAGIGWIAAIIIGGIAGWLAERFMKSDMGVLMNILLGIVGAAVANLLLGLIGHPAIKRKHDFFKAVSPPERRLFRAKKARPKACRVCS
jgi:uncharacterized membrane protein YeaQ/YmgE (transglycosylase-associated protein family)